MSDFEAQVQALHPDLRARHGLDGLKRADRERLSVTDPRQLRGSASLDDDLTGRYPSYARWDYLVAHGERVWFVEVHPASSDANLQEVKKKAAWLNTLLRGHPWRSRDNPRVWVSSGPISKAPAFSRKKRSLAQAGVVGPTRRLAIP
ncbi:MAG: hypothetical protein JXX28_13810 [Deltaproteobacteria bacterium]|nr:hypothetical protein [Deltaproteobacteria bacterium]